MVDNHSVPLFQEINPPQGLLPAILERIARARERAARVRLVLFGTVSLVSVLLLIPAVQYVLSEFYTSGFYDYASLFFDSLSRGYWKEVLYALADALPSFALLLLAAVSAMVVWSVRNMNRNARVVFARGTALA